MVTRPRFTILEAPSSLGLFPKGVETLPAALLEAGLAARLGAHHAGRIEPPTYNPQKDPATNIRNPQAIASYAVALADKIGHVLNRGEFPVVLGGDCSILLGCLLALRRKGRAGLLFLDGHADFYQPTAEPNGEAASMELAFVTGRGPAIIADLEGYRPLVRDQAVAMVGRRDGAEADAHGSQRVEETAIALFDLAAVRRDGAEECTTRALQRLAAPKLDGFWIHLDADVLDDAIMPAVDYRLPDGLHWEELTTILRVALASGRTVGLDITIFNPKLDSDGSIARRFVDALGKGLSHGNRSKLAQ